MAVPSYDARESTTTGASLLPLFTAALLIAIGPIVLVGLIPSVVTLAVAMATLVGLALAVMVILVRLIGPDEG